MRARSELRNGWRGVVALALLVGIFGGASLAAFAGARRTGSAVTRFYEASAPTEATVEAQPDQINAIGALPQVTYYISGGYVLGFVLGPDGKRVDHIYNPFAFDISRAPGGPFVVEGRRPRPDSATEVMVNESAAKRLSARLGSTIRFKVATFDQLEQLLGDVGANEQPKGPEMTLTVVGVMRMVQDLNDKRESQAEYESNDSMFLTHAFIDRYGDGAAIFQAISVKLDHPSDMPAFRAAVTKITGNENAVHLGSDDAKGADEARKATRVLAAALAVFGGFLFLVAFLVLGQMIGRSVVLSSDEDPILRSLGAPPRKIVGAHMARMLPIVLGGPLLAVLVALAASPMFPVGLARRAETSSGVQFDAFVLGVGALCMVVLLLARVVAPAVTAARARRSVATISPSRVARGALAVGAPVSVVAGTRLAMEPGRGARAVPVRAAIAGTATALIALMFTLVFGSSLDSLAKDPARWGWTWDAMVGNPHSGDVSKEAIPALRGIDGIVAVSGTSFSDSWAIEGRPTNVLAVRPAFGDVGPKIVSGRAPVAPDEIAMGTKILDQMHRSLGDTVQVTAGEEEHVLRVVGSTILPPSIMNSQTDLGGGALVSGSGMDAIAPGQFPVNVFIVKVTPTMLDQTMVKLREAFKGSVVTSTPPPEVRNLQAGGSLPVILSITLAVLAMLTIAQTTIVVVGRRSRDLAVLKTLGFVRRQVRAAVGWQAVLITLSAALIGVPLGLIAGRSVWTAYVTRSGLISPPTVYVPGVLAAVLLGVVLATLVSRVPARRAALTPAATVLRSE